MSKFITLHETQAAYEAVKNALSKPQVAVVKENDDVHYDPLVKVNNVLLNKNELTLVPNATETLVATVLPVNASDKSVTWSTSDSSVVTVSENGVVTAVGVGNATITVTTVDGGYSAQCATEVAVHVSGVSLNKNNLSIAPNATKALIATVLPVDATDKSVTWISSDSNVATVDSNGVVSGVSSGNATITVTTVDGGYSAQCAVEIIDPYNGHDYVEIGGMKWATMNVGASSITSYGNYFQWGDTNGYTKSQVGSGSGKKYFATNFEDYKYASGGGTSSSALTKYNSFDENTILDFEDDGVIKHWRGKWHTPTTEEWQALGEAVNAYWTNNYNSTRIGGLVCTAKDGSGTQLFFPAAGGCNNGKVSDENICGYYWSSSLNSNNVHSAHNLLFMQNGSGRNWNSSFFRYHGASLRGVIGESVSGVLLNKSELIIEPNTSKTLVATVLPVNAYDKSVTWSSSDSNVATVSDNGVVTAVGNVGSSATITVTTVDGGYTAQCVVEVGYINVSSVSLNKDDLTLCQGLSETLIATVLPIDASDKSVTWSSSDSSVATVDSNGVVTAIGDNGSAIITVTTVDGGYTAQCVIEASDPYGGHDYVEIGGLKWATMNVGATAVTDNGLYFSWGDTSGYTASQVGSGSGKKAFKWNDYKYGDGTSNPGNYTMKKYNGTDGKTVLDAEDDGVAANWGGRWRMPTRTELQELGNAVNTAWTSNYQSTGVAGLVCTAKDGSGAELFFPAAGRCIDGGVTYVGSYGYCWHNSLKSVQNAYLSVFQNNGVTWQDYSARYVGRSLRGVAD